MVTVNVISNISGNIIIDITILHSVYFTMGLHTQIPSKVGNSLDELSSTKKGLSSYLLMWNML